MLWYFFTSWGRGIFGKFGQNLITIQETGYQRYSDIGRKTLQAYICVVVYGPCLILRYDMILSFLFGI